MSDQYIIHQDKFWKLLEYIEELDGPVDQNTLLGDLELTPAEFQRFNLFLDSFEHSFSIKHEGSKKILIPPQKKEQIHVQLSFIEWLALQSQFDQQGKASKEPFFQFVAKKIAKIRRENPGYDLQEAFHSGNCGEEIFHQLDEFQRQRVGEIEECLNSKSVMLVSFFEESKVMDIFPHRLVYIDGRLSMVGEDYEDRCLVYFETDQVKRIVLDESREYRANYTHHEVNDFISAVRSMSGKESRLILKVSGQDKVDFSPKYHFFANPYLTQNEDGHTIWAGTVEASEELLEWLWGFRHHLEIIDPQNIKKAFVDYCESKGEPFKNNLKKAS